MLRQIGPVELVIILVIIILIFGPRRLGELGGALGTTIREFRKAVSSPDEDEKEEEGKEE